jgi:hypothetical protein
MNNVEAANLALSRIGQGTLRPISALSDNTEHAAACDRVFQTTLRAVLSEFTWPFARACAALGELTLDPIPGWEYAYSLPATALSLRYVESDGFVPDWISLSRQVSRWEVMAHPIDDGQIIVTDTPEAFAWYTKAITEVLYTSELFGQAFAWRLAAEVALGLKADPKLAENAMNMYAGALDVAICAAINQRGGQLPMEAETVLARGAGALGYQTSPWTRGG